MKEFKVGVVRFPGSNCDFDTLNYFQEHRFAPEFIWYKDSNWKPYDLLVLPGGFAFGDRVYERATQEYAFDPGKQAVVSPVMEIVHKTAQKGLPILGICNGFQILVHAGLLPGRLEKNASGKFFCDFTDCLAVGQSFFHDVSMLGRSFRIPVAHGYGRFTADEKSFERLSKDGQIFLKYLDNPNGSFGDIAGVCNKKGTIFGMMPHPERSPDGHVFAKALKKYLHARV